MLVATEGGDTYTFHEIKTALEAVGFIDIWQIQQRDTYGWHRNGKEALIGFCACPDCLLEIKLKETHPHGAYEEIYDHQNH
jgi:hypothetical protein